MVARIDPSHRHLSPYQSLVGGFVAITVLGAVLLSLPMASSQRGTPFLDALFTATSAVTTTGLIVVDTGSHYSLFGEIVILALFQVGGLGYMAFIALLVLIARRRLSLAAGQTLRESIAGFQGREARQFLKAVFVYTVAFEVTGAAVLGLSFLGDFSPGRALYLGVFHSVSGFCTAGFSLFADSFVGYRDHGLINATIAVITMAGSLGFFVLRELRRRMESHLRGELPVRVSLHTRLTLTVSLALMGAASVLVLLVEPASTLGAGMSSRLAASSFQGLSASTTTGFNTIDIGAMTTTGQFALIVFMFIGASPGGTGGGIKTTTMGVVLLTALALVRGREDAEAFHRRIARDTVHRSMTVGLLATTLVVMGTLVLTVTERASFLPIAFEMVSAFGTVGLSAGITGDLTMVGKVVIILTMLIGRLGTLAVGYALLARPRPVRFDYAREQVFIG